MMDRRKYSLSVAALLAVLFITSLTVTVYAQEKVEAHSASEAMTLQQVWAGASIRQASLNWADYAQEPAIVAAPEQVWAGASIRQASLNWADYAQEPAIVAAPEQVWAGASIRQASLNWADYAQESAIAQITD